MYYALHANTRYILDINIIIFVGSLLDLLAKIKCSNIIIFVGILIIKALLKGSKETEVTSYADKELTDIYYTPPLSNQ